MGGVSTVIEAATLPSVVGNTSPGTPIEDEQEPSHGLVRPLRGLATHLVSPPFRLQIHISKTILNLICSGTGKIAKHRYSKVLRDVRVDYLVGYTIIHPAFPYRVE